MKKLRSDALGALSNFDKFFENLAKGCDARVEEQWTAISLRDLQQKLNDLGSLNYTTDRLLEEKKIVAISREWSEYVNNAVAQPILLLKSVFKKVSDHGCLQLTLQEIVECHEAETAIKFFVDKHLYLKYDYYYAKKMIQDGVIRICQLKKEPFVPVQDVQNVVVAVEQPPFWYVEKKGNSKVVARNVVDPGKYGRRDINMGRTGQHFLPCISLSVDLILRCFLTIKNTENEDHDDDTNPAIVFLFQLLGTASRRFQALPNYVGTVTKHKTAFKKSAVEALFQNAKNRKGTQCYGKIAGSCTVKDIIKYIEKPSTLIGALVEET